MSFLALEGLHVFVTGAAGGIGSQAVKEFLSEFTEELHIFLRHSLYLRCYRPGMQSHGA